MQPLFQYHVVMQVLNLPDFVPYTLRGTLCEIHQWLQDKIMYYKHLIIIHTVPHSAVSN